LQWHLSKYQRIVPKNVPWVGPKKDEWFARTRAQVREWWEGKENIMEGYNKVRLALENEAKHNE
jgi:hypothetical protein